jgi:hypothetical protein
MADHKPDHQFQCVEWVLCTAFGTMR